MTSYQTISTPQDYVNYTFNISSRGIAEVSGEMVGLSNTVTTILGQLAFKTSEYLTHTESAMIGLGTAAVASFASSTQEAIKFEQAIANVQAIGGESINAMDIGQAAMRYSNQFGMDVNSMTEGLEALSRAGLTATNVMSGVLAEGVKLSKLEGMDLEDSINDLISTTNLLAENQYDVNSQEYADAVKAMNQHIVSTSESAPINAQNIIQTLQHAGGYVSSAKIDQDDLFAVIAQLGSKGTKGEMAGTALRAFIAAGQKDQAQRALSRIGLDVSDLWDESGNIMLPVSEMKQVLDDALEARGYSQQEKLEFYSDFAGYKQANQIMKIDTSEVQEYKKTIEQAWDLGTKLETILGTTHNNIQTLFQTVKNFMTRTGSTILPLINAIIIPIKWGVQLLDAMPFSENIVGMALAFAGLKAAVLFINRVVPSIAGLYTSLSKSNDKAEGIYGHFKNFREELEQSRDILEHISDRDYLANIRVHQGLMGRQSHIQHKDITRTLYTDVFRKQNPDILPWKELSSTQQELYYSIAENLKNTEAYQDIIDQFNKANEGHIHAFMNIVRGNEKDAPKSNLETNKELRLNKQTNNQDDYKFAAQKNLEQTSKSVDELHTALKGLHEGTQYDIGKSILSIKEPLAEAIGRAVAQSLNTKEVVVSDTLGSFQIDGRKASGAIKQLQEIESNVSVDLGDIGYFLDYDPKQIDTLLAKVRGDLQQKITAYQNDNPLFMNDTQATRMEKSISGLAKTNLGTIYSAEQNSIDVLDVLKYGKVKQYKKANIGIHEKQMDAIEEALGMDNQSGVEREKRLNNIHKYLRDTHKGTKAQKQDLINEILKTTEDIWINTISHDNPGVEASKFLTSDRARYIGNNIGIDGVDWNQVNNPAERLIEYFKDTQPNSYKDRQLKQADRLMFTFMEGAKAQGQIFNEAEAQEIGYLIRRYRQLLDARNKKATNNNKNIEDAISDASFGVKFDAKNNRRVFYPDEIEDVLNSGYNWREIPTVMNSSERFQDLMQNGIFRTDEDIGSKLGTSKGGDISLNMDSMITSVLRAHLMPQVLETVVHEMAHSMLQHTLRGHTIGNVPSNLIIPGPVSEEGEAWGTPIAEYEAMSVSKKVSKMMNVPLPKGFKTNYKELEKLIERDYGNFDNVNFDLINEAAMNMVENINQVMVVVNDLIPHKSDLDRIMGISHVDFLSDILDKQFDLRHHQERDSVKRQIENARYDNLNQQGVRYNDETYYNLNDIYSDKNLSFSEMEYIEEQLNQLKTQNNNLGTTSSTNFTNKNNLNDENDIIHNAIGIGWDNVDFIDSIKEALGSVFEDIDLSIDNSILEDIKTSVENIYDFLTSEPITTELTTQHNDKEFSGTNNNFFIQGDLHVDDSGDIIPKNNVVIDLTKNQSIDTPSLDYELSTEELKEIFFAPIVTLVHQTQDEMADFLNFAQTFTLLKQGIEIIESKREEELTAELNYIADVIQQQEHLKEIFNQASQEMLTWGTQILNYIRGFSVEDVTDKFKDFIEDILEIPEKLVHIPESNGAFEDLRNKNKEENKKGWRNPQEPRDSGEEIVIGKYRVPGGPAGGIMPTNLMPGGYPQAVKDQIEENRKNRMIKNDTDLQAQRAAHLKRVSDNQKAMNDFLDMRQALFSDLTEKYKKDSDSLTDDELDFIGLNNKRETKRNKKEPTLEDYNKQLNGVLDAPNRKEQGRQNRIQKEIEERNKKAREEVNKKWEETKRLRVFGGVIANDGAVQGPLTQREAAKASVERLKKRNADKRQKEAEEEYDKKRNQELINFVDENIVTQGTTYIPKGAPTGLEQAATIKESQEYLIGLANEQVVQFYKEEEKRKEEEYNRVIENENKRLENIENEKKIQQGMVGLNEITAKAEEKIRREREKNILLERIILDELKRKFETGLYELTDEELALIGKGEYSKKGNSKVRADALAEKRKIEQQKRLQEEAKRVGDIYSSGYEVENKPDIDEYQNKVKKEAQKRKEIEQNKHVAQQKISQYSGGYDAENIDDPLGDKIAFWQEIEEIEQDAIPSKVEQANAAVERYKKHQEALHKQIRYHVKKEIEAMDGLLIGLNAVTDEAEKASQNVNNPMMEKEQQRREKINKEKRQEQERIRKEERKKRNDDFWAEQEQLEKEGTMEDIVKKRKGRAEHADQVVEQMRRQREEEEAKAKRQKEIDDFWAEQEALERSAAYDHIGYEVGEELGPGMLHTMRHQLGVDKLEKEREEQEAAAQRKTQEDVTAGMNMLNEEVQKAQRERAEKIRAQYSHISGVNTNANYEGMSDVEKAKMKADHRYGEEYERETVIGEDGKPHLSDYKVKRKQSWTERSERFGIKMAGVKEQFFDAVSNVANQYPEEQAKQYSEAIGGVKDKVEGALGAMKGFNAGLERAAEVFPPLTVATTALNTVISIGEGIVWALDIAQSILGATQSFGILQTLGLATAEQVEALQKGVATLATWGLTTAIAALEAVMLPLLIVVGAVIAAISLLKFWENKHAESLKKTQEALKEATAKNNTALSQYKDLKKARENETDAIKKQQAARKEAIALYELESARVKQNKAIKEESKVRNDAIWGEYGMRADLQKAGLGIIAGGDFESQYEQYDGTTKNIRQIKESTVGDIFKPTGAKAQVANTYDDNHMFFSMIEAYQKPLTELYSKESKLIEQYGSLDDARASEEFYEAVQEFADATGLQGETAGKMLDWLETENKVNQATQAMQARVNMIVAKADANALAAEVEDTDFGAQNLQEAMIYAQAQDIYKEAYDYMWWEKFQADLFGILWTIIDAITVWDWTDHASQYWKKSEAYQEGMKELSELGVQGLSEIGDNTAEHADRRDYGSSGGLYYDTPFGGAKESAALQYADQQQQKAFEQNHIVYSESEYQAIQENYLNYGPNADMQLHDMIKSEKEYAQEEAKDFQNSLNKDMTETGQAGVEGFKEGLDQHSPGLISRSVQDEMNYSNIFIIEATPQLSESTHDLGSEMSDSHKDALAISDNTQQEMVNVNDTIKDSKDTINPTAYDAGYEAGQEYGKGFKEGLKDLFAQISSPEALEQTLEDRILVRQGYGTPKGADPNDPEVQKMQEQRRHETESKLLARGFSLPSLSSFAKNEGQAAYRVAKGGGLRSWKDTSVIGRIANAAEIGITEGSLSKGAKALFSPKYGEEFGVKGAKHAVNKLFGRETGEAVARAPTGKVVGAVDDTLGKAGAKGGKYVEKGLSKLGIEGGESLAETGGKFVARHFGDDAAKLAVKGGSKLAKMGSKAIPFVGTAITAATSIMEHNPFEKHYNEDGSEKRALQSTGEVAGEITGAIASDVVGAVAGPVAGMAAGLILEPIGEAIGGTIGWMADEVVNTKFTDAWAGFNDALGGIPGQLVDFIDQSPIGQAGHWAFDQIDNLTGGWLGDTWEYVKNSSIAELTGLDQLGGALQGMGEWLFGSGEDKQEQLPAPDQITDEQIAELENAGMLDEYLASYGLDKEQTNILDKAKAKTKPLVSNGSTVIIKNININTEDDPEKIKSALMNLIIEMQEQVNPRQVSRTVGEPPATQSTSTDQNQNNTAQAQGTDPQSGAQNNNTNSNTSPNTNT